MKANQSQSGAIQQKRNHGVGVGRGFVVAGVALTIAVGSISSAIADDHEGVEKKVLVAVVQPTEGNVAHGVATFTDTPDGVEVRAMIYGLKPNAKHAIHVHEFGDVSAADGTSAGGHFNPDGHEHGLTDQAERHAGDLGNLSADENGIADYEFTAKGIRATVGDHAIIGRTLVIHAGADDGGQPTGNAGARIAVAVIGYKNPSLKDLWHLGTEKGEIIGEEAASGVEKVIRKVDKAVGEAADTIGDKARETKQRVEEKLDGD